MRAKTAIVSVAVLAAAGLAEDRDVQFRGMNFNTGVLQISNYGNDSVDLSGWRFCTQDDDQRLQYTDPGALKGVILDQTESIYIHFNDDAADPGHFNHSDMGRWSTPVDNDLHSIALFHPNKDGAVVFGDGTLMSDFVQWSIDGEDDDIADERSDEAVKGGVWTGESDWIVTSKTTTYIRLTDTTGGVLHGPKNYEALDEMPDCNDNGVDDFIDVNFGGSEDANENGIPDECEGCDADLDGDGDADADDFFDYLDAFATGNLPVCDIDTDGDCDADDFFGYLDRFAQGC